MPAVSGHPVFPPLSAETRLWRYLDFTKYAAILEGRGLFLPRADLLGDPFEGSRSRANFENRKAVYGDQDLPTDMQAELSRFSEWERQWTYISCWHAND